MMQPVRFTAADVDAAFSGWGANCGPGAIAAVLHLTLNELRPRLGDFERRGYTSPSMMYGVLRGLRIPFDVRMANGAGDVWPSYGLARIQWEGPWLAAGVPIAARYRHTHWIGCRDEEVFDINGMSVGGWMSLAIWRDQLVPWLLRQCAPRASGGWYLTHSIEIDPAVAASCRSRLEASPCR